MEAIELKILARDWAWLIELDAYMLLSVSPFGDLLLEDRTGAKCLLDVNLGALEYADEEGNNLASLFPQAFDDRIAAGYRRAQLFLKPGTCYGYKVQSVIGGSFDPDNVYIATLMEYVSFMGCFHEQIKDIADGESVQIKIVRGPVN